MFLERGMGIVEKGGVGRDTRITNSKQRTVSNLLFQEEGGRPGGGLGPLV